MLKFVKKVVRKIKKKIKKIIKKIIKKVKKPVKKVMNRAVRLGYKMLYRFIPIDKKTILFISFHGRGYTDNPKALHEYMCSQEEFKDYKFVWALTNPKACDIPNAKKIKYLSAEYFWYLSRSKYWFSNCKLPEYILKKHNQIYLQTWHGTPLKRLAHDIELAEGTTFYRTQMSAEDMKNTYDVDVARYNYMISPNGFCTEVFQSAFRINRERLIETGYPRNDILTNATTEKIDRIKEELDIPKNKKVVLYAPTWRDNSYVTSGYTFELKVDFHRWREILGDEYVVIFKPHYLIINKYKSDDSLKGFLYNIDAKSEISDLYLISDYMITDYSSVFFDYAILKKPIYFYMYDVEEYASELRGFYLDIYKDLPGDICESEEEMLKKLVNNDFDYERLALFNKRFNHMEDGQSSKRVIDIIFER